MTEPINPLFEDEKEFLERKKLEYERALRGDVEEIKETTVQVGKVALVGAGIVGGIWLLSKAFGGDKKKKKQKHKKQRQYFEDYAGFDGFDENDQELSELATDFQGPAYGDFDSNDGVADGFYAGYNEQSVGNEDNEDDNGLSNYADYSAHSASQLGSDSEEDTYLGTDHGDEEGAAHSYASANSYQARPYDDSRRLPHSTGFAEDEDTIQDTDSAVEHKQGVILPALIAFAKSETGRVVVAQAAAVALALVTKAVQGFTSGHEEETGKNADLAASSANAGISPATWPATSAAQDVADAAHHEESLTPREPLA